VDRFWLNRRARAPHLDWLPSYRISHEVWEVGWSLPAWPSPGIVPKTQPLHLSFGAPALVSFPLFRVPDVSSEYLFPLCYGVQLGFCGRPSAPPSGPVTLLAFPFYALKFWVSARLLSPPQFIGLRFLTGPKLSLHSSLVTFVVPQVRSFLPPVTIS